MELENKVHVVIKVERQLKSKGAGKYYLWSNLSCWIEYLVKGESLVVRQDLRGQIKVNEMELQREYFFIYNE